MSSLDDITGLNDYYMDEYDNWYRIVNGYVFLYGEHAFEPVPEGFDLTWILDPRDIPTPAPIPYTGEPFDDLEDLPGGNPIDPPTPEGSEENPARANIDDLILALAESWVTDRTEEHINNVLHGSITINDIDRACISLRVAERWEYSIETMQTWLNTRGIYPQCTFSSPSRLQRMTCTNPHIPFPYSPEWAAPDPDREDDTWRPYEESMGYGENPVFEMFECFREIISIMSVDVSDLTIPQTAEFLYWYEINDLEEAMRRANQKMLDTYDSRKTHYSGQLISGGYIYV